MAQILGTGTLPCLAAYMPPSRLRMGRKPALEQKGRGVKLVHGHPEVEVAPELPRSPFHGGQWPVVPCNSRSSGPATQAAPGLLGTVGISCIAGYRAFERHCRLRPGSGEMLSTYIWLWFLMGIAGARCGVLKNVLKLCFITLNSLGFSWSSLQAVCSERRCAIRVR